MAFQPVDPLALERNPFDLMEEGVLVTARLGDDINTLTVGWGGFGSIWGRHVVFMAVRPERYTFKFTQEADTFSVTVLPKGKRSLDILNYCGTHSGRDYDKIKACGLTTAFEGTTPYFEEGELIFICNKLANPQLSPNDVSSGHGILEKWYGGGFHHLYIGEITKILLKEAD